MLYSAAAASTFPAAVPIQAALAPRAVDGAGGAGVAMPGLQHYHPTPRSSNAKRKQMRRNSQATHTYHQSSTKTGQ